MNPREVLKEATDQALKAWLALDHELHPDDDLEHDRTMRAGVAGAALLGLFEALIDLPDEDVAALYSVIDPLWNAVWNALPIREVAA